MSVKYYCDICEEEISEEKYSYAEKYVDEPELRAVPFSPPEKAVVLKVCQKCKEIIEKERKIQKGNKENVIEAINKEWDIKWEEYIISIRNKDRKGD